MRKYLLGTFSCILLLVNTVNADNLPPLTLKKGEIYELRITSTSMSRDALERKPTLRKNVNFDMYEFVVREVHRKKGYALEVTPRHSEFYSFKKWPDDPRWYQTGFWNSDILAPKFVGKMRGDFDSLSFVLRLTPDFQVLDSLKEKEWYNDDLGKAFLLGKDLVYQLTDTTYRKEYPQGMVFWDEQEWNGRPHKHQQLEVREQMEIRFSKIDTSEYRVVWGEDEKQSEILRRTNTRVRGKIKQLGEDKEIQVVCGFDFPVTERKIYHVPVKDGEFEFRLNLLQPLSYVSLPGEHSLFLEPGDDLYIEMDSLYAREYRFSGLGAGNNQYYEKEGSKWGYTIYRIDRENKLSTREYYAALDRNAENFRKNMERYRSSFTLIFYQYMLNDFKYRTAYQKLITRGDSTVRRSDCIQGIEVCNPLALVNSLYRSWLRNVMSTVLPREVALLTQAEGPFGGDYERAVILLDGRVLNMYLVDLISEKLKSDFTAGEALYHRYKVDFLSSPYTEALDRVYEKARKLAPGCPAPDFTLHDTAGHEVSLVDFRGKVVYIDFWGTGCSPCMYEFENYVPALKEYFHGKDVVFLNISTDKKESMWKRTLAKFNIQGVNLIDTKDSAVGKLYMVTGIPHYVLIGRDGKIIDPHAPRPSMNIRAAIEKALVK